MSASVFITPACGASLPAPRHLIPVLAADGMPLTPTTPAHARRLLAGRQATKHWTRLGTFAIQLMVATRHETPRCGVGVDHGAVSEGYAVVCGTENVLAMTLSLPDKTQAVRKMAERRRLRHARRGRTTRRRPARFSNRRPGPGWIAPSQLVLVLARERMMCTLCALYPITLAGIEDVRFDHRKRWGTYFSTVEIGKERLRRWWDAHGVNASYYQGYETKAKREEYGYRKTHDKRAEVFTAHCTDALTLGCMVVTDAPVAPGPFVVVNNRYRPVRRRLHDSQPARGGVRAAYSRGTVHGLQKGRLVGTPRGRSGQLCGSTNGAYRFYDAVGQRRVTKELAWIHGGYSTMSWCVPQRRALHSPLP